MKLGSREIGAGHRPYFIAEMSGNHNHSLERALAIVEAAAASGADALKLQTYTPDTMTIDLAEGDFFINDPSSLWKGNSLYDLYKIAMTPWDWHKPIMKKCKELKLDFFSTPFDATAVDFLEDLGVDFYKIASFENTDIPLIKKVAQTGKPIIISTGMASVSEISEAAAAARSGKCKDLVLLKCTSAYPSPSSEMNISTIRNLRETFNVEAGLSDHTMGSAVAIAAAALGASVIEKHFTLKRSDGGVDSAFSMEPDEFKSMVKDVTQAWESLGQVQYGLTQSEKKSKVFRRSIYFVKDVKKGESITTENVRIIRPGFGMEPKFFETILGRKASQDFKRGTALDWDKIY